MSFLRVALALAVISGIRAETHTLKFVNNCGFGTPTLLKDGKVLTLNNGEYTAQGGFSSAIAYLQTGGCGFNGEKCSTMEMTLNNAFSSADITLIDPHAFNVPIKWEYYNGCDGLGKSCLTANCGADSAFYKFDDYGSQQQCTTPNVNLLTTFCPSGSTSQSSSSHTTSSTSSSSTSTHTTTTTKTSAHAPSPTSSTLLTTTTLTSSSTSTSSTGAVLPTSTVPRKMCKKGGARKKRDELPPTRMQHVKRNAHHRYGERRH